MSFVVKTGKDLKALAHREKFIEKIMGSEINSGAKVLRKEEGLIQRKAIRIHLGLENIKLSERIQTQMTTYYVV